MRCALYSRRTSDWCPILGLLYGSSQFLKLPSAVETARGEANVAPIQLRTGRLFAMSDALGPAYGDGMAATSRAQQQAMEAEARGQFAAWRRVLGDVKPDLIVADTDCPGGLAAAAEDLGAPVIWIEPIPELALSILLDPAEEGDYAPDQVSHTALSDHLECRLAPIDKANVQTTDHRTSAFVGVMIEDEGSGRLRRDALERPSQHAALLRVARDLQATARLTIVAPATVPWRRAAARLKNVAALRSEVPTASFAGFDALIGLTGTWLWLAPMLGVPVFALAPTHPALAGTIHPGVRGTADWGDMRGDLDHLLEAGNPDRRRRRAAEARAAFAARFAGRWLSDV